jgi:hypothetical protein
MRKRSLREESAPLPPLGNEPPPTATALASPHRVEQEVQRCLLADPGLRFSSLVIHRIRDGVCLEGILEIDDECPDICNLVKQVAGVDTVLNHLVVRGNHRPPAKG